MAQEMPKIAVLLGSVSDGPKVEKALRVLSQLQVAWEVKVLSAHRNPDALERYAASLEQRQFICVIAAAGMAAHLAGAVAARTALPVIGLPLSGGALGGLDALLSTVSMPPGVPVATVAVDGSENAAILAAQIVAVAAPSVRIRLQERKQRELQIREEKAGAWLERMALEGGEGSNG